LKDQTEAVKVNETKRPSKFQGKSRAHSTPVAVNEDKEGASSAPVTYSKTEPSSSSDSGNAAALLPLESPISEVEVTKSVEVTSSKQAAALHSWTASNVSRDTTRRVNSLDSQHVAAASLQQVTEARVVAAEARNLHLRAQLDQILDQIEQKDKEIAGLFACCCLRTTSLRSVCSKCRKASRS
jgi:hypothetical protein